MSRKNPGKPGKEANYSAALACWMSLRTTHQVVQLYVVKSRCGEAILESRPMGDEYGLQERMREEELHP